MDKPTVKKVAPAPTEEDGSEVGYCRPPTHGQFKPGQSGNRKGRPRDATTIASMLRTSLEQKVSVRQGGRTVKMSKAAIGITKGVNKFVESGDIKYLKAYGEVLPEFLGSKTNELLEQLVEAKGRPNTLAILAWHRERILEASGITPAAEEES